MRVRRPTELIRATAGKSLVPLLGPEANDPDTGANLGAGAYRRVQVCTPESPVMLFSIDQPSPTDIGLDRNYHVPRLPPDQVLRFVLLPGQSLFGMASEGIGHATLVVEYLLEE